MNVDALRRLQAELQHELEALLPSILDRAFKGGKHLDHESHEGDLDHEPHERARKTRKGVVRFK